MLRHGYEDDETRAEATAKTIVSSIIFLYGYI